jgi:hypothetical protein
MDEIDAALSIDKDLKVEVIEKLIAFAINLKVDDIQ